MIAGLAVEFLLLLGLGGALCGSLVAFVFRRSHRPFFSTLTIAPILAAVVCLVIIGILTTLDALWSHSYSLGQALSTGLATVFVYGIGLGFLCAVPAALVGLVMQALLQLFKKCCFHEKPPPLPGAS